MTARNNDIVLILGSGPQAPHSRGWDRSQFSDIVAINNAWNVRPDWTHLIHPEDFPPARRPSELEPGQRMVDHTEYVPQTNRFGGMVYAGGTMAFTAGYWALGALQPRILAFMGCDMVYPSKGRTHFYGTGTADPLRDDLTLQSLEAKSARLWFMAAEQGCLCVNLSTAPSRLLFPRAAPAELAGLPPITAPHPKVTAPAILNELKLGYTAPDGRYWEQRDQYDATELARIDALWLDAWGAASVAVA